MEEVFSHIRVPSHKFTVSHKQAQLLVTACVHIALVFALLYPHEQTIAVVLTHMVNMIWIWVE